MVVVDQPPADPQRVFFGAWVTVEDESGTSHLYRVVGPDEFDREPEFLSMDSPLGKVLLGKRLDAEVTLSLPTAERRLVIVGIGYGARPPHK